MIPFEAVINYRLALLGFNCEKNVSSLFGLRLDYKDS